MGTGANGAKGKGKVYMALAPKHGHHRSRES